LTGVRWFKARMELRRQTSKRVAVPVGLGRSIPSDKWRRTRFGECPRPKSLVRVKTLSYPRAFSSALPWDILFFIHDLHIHTQPHTHLVERFQARAQAAILHSHDSLLSTPKGYAAAQSDKHPSLNLRHSKDFDSHSTHVLERPGTSYRQAQLQPRTCTLDGVAAGA